MKSMKWLLRIIKNKVKKLICYVDLLKLNTKCKRKPVCFLFMIPEYGNLGDQAIAYAQHRFIADNLCGYEILEIPVMYYLYGKKIFRRMVRTNDLIALIGGGNMGTLWFDFEIERREIITGFPHNKILSFPQSVFYGDDEFGINEYEKSKEIYTSHKNLHLFAREEYSYRIFKEAYINNVYLAPDMVLYLDKSKPSFIRQGVLMCLRDDKEKSITTGLASYINTVVRKYTNNVIYTDTVILKRIPVHSREKYIDKKLEEFKKSKLVITDRLHGLVFSVITATPCLVFGNCYHKVKGTYEWVKHLNYIKYCEKESDMEAYIDELWQVEDLQYDNNYLIPEYDVLCKVLQSDSQGYHP